MEVVRKVVVKWKLTIGGRIVRILGILRVNRGRARKDSPQVGNFNSKCKSRTISTNNQCQTLLSGRGGLRAQATDVDTLKEQSTGNGS